MYRWLLSLQSQKNIRLRLSRTGAILMLSVCSITAYGQPTGTLAGQPTGTLAEQPTGGLGEQTAGALTGQTTGGPGEHETGSLNGKLRPDYFPETRFPEAHFPEDSARGKRLREVEISAHRIQTSANSVSPYQVIERKQLQMMQGTQASDAIRQFSGITLRDYGGIGGLKTVSIRSLGAGHTTVGYDGLPVSDGQTGQIDLGRFSLFSIEKISLNTGQSENLLQPAQMFASAGVVHIETVMPQLSDARPFALRGVVRGGSFGLFQPALAVAFRLWDKWSAEAEAEWLRSDGRYPFTLNYGGAADSSSREKRINSDLSDSRFSLHAQRNSTDHKKASLRAEYRNSERGLPGPVIFYNSFSKERLQSNDLLLQGRYQNSKNRVEWQVNAKVARKESSYLEVRNSLPDGSQESHYLQYEGLASGAIQFRAAEGLLLSTAHDFHLLTLSSNLPHNLKPVRTSWLGVAAARYQRNQWVATASLLSTRSSDHLPQGKSGKLHQRWSPYVGVQYRLSEQSPVRLRLFYKESFRLPTFNDLYYPRMGNPSLNPEIARQWNLGATWVSSPGKVLNYLSIRADGFRNRIKNQLVAMPRQSMFIWTVTNFGQTRIEGADFSAESRWRLHEALTVEASGSFTLQKAVDVSNPNSSSYNQQIPYTPRQSGAAMLALQAREWSLTYQIWMAGTRYTMAQNIDANRLDPYNEQSISMARRWQVGSVLLTLKGEIQNLTNQTYQVVKSYPMPGRSFRIGLYFEL